MSIMSLAWKNLDRNRTRTIITISAIFFAVVLSVLTSSLRAGIFNQLVDNLTQSYSGKIQLHAPGYWDEPSLDKTFHRDSSIEFSLLGRAGVEFLLPRLETFVLVASDRSTKGAQLIGVDPAGEDRMSGLQKEIIAGKFPNSDTRGLLVAAGMLKRLNAKLGDTLVILGQGYHGTMAAAKFPIVGVVRLGAPDLNDHLLFIPLLWMQDLLQAPDRLTSYVIDTKDQNNLDLLKQSIQAAVGSGWEVMTWQEMMPDIDQHIRTDTRNMRIVQWVLHLLVSFGIFGTFLMLLKERSHEFGMLLALGLQKTQLAAILVWESFFVFGLGVLLGLVFSLPLLILLHQYPIRLQGSIAAAYERFGFEAVFPAALDSEIFWEQGVTVFIIGVFLSIYLVIRVFRLNAIKAMR
jgi:putative ABC transport system permease protein